MTESKVQRSLPFQTFTGQDIALPDNGVLIDTSKIRPSRRDRAYRLL